MVPGNLRHLLEVESTRVSALTRILQKCRFSNVDVTISMSAMSACSVYTVQYTVVCSAVVQCIAVLYTTVYYMSCWSCEHADCWLSVDTLSHSQLYMLTPLYTALLSEHVQQTERQCVY